VMFGLSCIRAEALEAACSGWGVGGRRGGGGGFMQVGQVVKLGNSSKARKTYVAGREAMLMILL